MATTTVTTEPDIDLDALRADAEQRLEELRGQRARLSLDSLTDEQAAAELVDVESELAAAEGILSRTDLARDERERRETQAIEDAERENRQHLQGDVAKLDAEARPLAEACDEKLRAAADAVRAFEEVDTPRNAIRGELEQAEGKRTVYGRPFGPTLQAALSLHLTEAGLPPRLLRFAEPREGRSLTAGEPAAPKGAK
jgi:hypothetical protein